ncbi:glycoside hydrolase family 88 protein [Streptomyces sp. 150FB]|uniref:glycoside hydrolase family 88 protein n=1 Tax=Streptomyces sp. 150FB TaxID=1576605 RepID=UPI000A6028EA|nr:glycoside hydrolase family 88 protein [Streptomyces sp. 150FB]
MKRTSGVLAAIAGLVLSTSVFAGQSEAAPAPAPEATAPGAPAVAADCAVTDSMNSAADYWLANGTDLASADWQNATFHVGNLAMVLASGESNHQTLPWAEANEYQLISDPDNEFNPANEAAGNAYLDLYTYFHQDAPILAALRQRVSDEVTSVQKGNTKYWNHVDALNMAWPSFVRLGVMDKNDADIQAAQELFHHTEKQAGGHGLFNELTGLWYQSPDDVNSLTFWSRGNGWAFAGLTTVLQSLPADDPRRPEYLRVYKKMAGTLRFVQRRDGFWNVDLLNPLDHPGPESSGTSLFTYGLAWGVANGVLNTHTYKPAVDKAWNALTTKALQPNGEFGYVQGEASGPRDAQPVTSTDTAAYGVGAYLMAGQQVAKLTPGCEPAPTPALTGTSATG